MLLQLWPEQHIAHSSLQYNAKVFIPASATAATAGTGTTPTDTPADLVEEHTSSSGALTTRQNYPNVKRKRKEATNSRRIVKTLRKLVVEPAEPRDWNTSRSKELNLEAQGSPYKLEPFPNLKDSFRAIAEDYGYNEKAFAHWNRNCCSLVH